MFLALRFSRLIYLAINECLQWNLLFNIVGICAMYQQVATIVQKDFGDIPKVYVWDGEGNIG